MYYLCAYVKKGMKDTSTIHSDWGKGMKFRVVETLHITWDSSILFDCEMGLILTS